ncbi:CreA protein [Chitinasiproducens palmae]|uniref:CreA protein n=1 Tax=Chitinasiproducens palmae TaxID=1770053 RepID=A0A1H2PTV6_9BURK|nr:CreA protein [Chitinasiproducens palmae]
MKRSFQSDFRHRGRASEAASQSQSQPQLQSQSHRSDAGWRTSGIGRVAGAALSLLLLGAGAATLAPGAAQAEEIGSVRTHFKITGSDRVVVEAYDDPLVPGVTCYVSRARTGGIKGSLGVAEDPTEASIACRQTGPVSFAGPLPQQTDVFSERLSFIFKTLHVVRIVDRPRNTLVYLTYSDRVVTGSAKNGVSAVPIPANQKIPVK